MNTVTIVDLKGGVDPRPPHIAALVDLMPGKVVTHYHQPDFKTAFHPWFTQLKKRYNVRHLRSSRYAWGKGGLQDGHGGRRKLLNPPGFFTVWNPRSG